MQVTAREGPHLGSGTRCLSVASCSLTPGEGRSNTKQEISSLLDTCVQSASQDLSRVRDKRSCNRTPEGKEATVSLRPYPAVASVQPVHSPLSPLCVSPRGLLWSSWPLPTVSSSHLCCPLRHTAHHPEAWAQTWEPQAALRGLAVYGLQAFGSAIPFLAFSWKK